MLNPTAMLWAKRQMELAERADLRRLAAELREKNIEMRPMIERAKIARQALMRFDGPTGFVMVPR